MYTVVFRLVSAEPQRLLFVYLFILAMLAFEDVHKMYFDY